MSLEDRLAAALRKIGGPRNLLSGYDAWCEANNALAEYDRSQEACDCEHAHGRDFHAELQPAHVHTRAHCQPTEPASQEACKCEYLPAGQPCECHCSICQPAEPAL